MKTISGKAIDFINEMTGNTPKQPNGQPVPKLPMNESDPNYYDYHSDHPGGYQKGRPIDFGSDNENNRLFNESILNELEDD